MLMLFAALFIFWLILASNVSTSTIVIGLVATLLIVFYSFDLIFTPKEKPVFHRLLPWRILVVFFVLLKEVIKANVVVAKIVLSPKLEIKPVFKTIKQPLKKDLTQAMFANAITLTPGTLTVDMDDDVILVHGLFEHNIDAIETGPILASFKALEGRVEHD